ncbi:MAG: FAD:protein FMN transferase [Bacteroidota bacterium]
MKKLIIMLLCLQTGITAWTQNRFEFSHPQMGTVFRLVFYSGQDSAVAYGLAKIIFDRIDSLNAHFSDWLPESELSMLCQKAGEKGCCRVSAELADILFKSNSFARQSRGAFDISVGALTRLWRRSRNLKELPAPEKIASALKTVGWKSVSVCPDRSCARLRKKGTMLDLGGIAQGWTADDCLGILRSNGVSAALVDAGGDIALGDPPPGREGWQIEIPSANGKKLMLLKNCGITTSGATYRYLELDGKRYSHIIDPRTGQPLVHRTQVTVLAENATTADAWATAISVLGEKGWNRLKRKPEINVWISESPL